MMWKPSDLGSVVAERDLVLETPGQPATPVRVQIGRPVRSPQAEEHDPWWCPIVISGLGEVRPEMVAGEDSLQALVLGLDYVTRALRSGAQEAGGTVTWLGEREHPVFANQWQLEWYEELLSDLLDGARSAMRLLEGDTAGGRAAALAKLRETLDATKFEPTPRVDGEGSGAR